LCHEADIAHQKTVSDGTSSRWDASEQILRLRI
jgi:hypothetical protein